MDNKELEKATENYIDTILELQREDYHSQLESFEAHKERSALIMKEKAGEYWDNLFKGLHLTLDLLTEEEDKKQLSKCLEMIGEFGPEAVGKSSTVPNDLLLTMYGIALHFFDDKKFEEAQNVLVFLTFLNPYFTTLWLAQGLVQEEMQKPDVAIESYKMAIIADPEDIEGYKNCIRCLLDAGRIGEAHTVADVGLQSAEGLPAEFSQEMEEIKQYISKQGGNNNAST
jgi:tetratricopeptide (TPR) repeat protein